jgi:hypothetical protein
MVMQEALQDIIFHSKCACCGRHQHLSHCPALTSIHPQPMLLLLLLLR